MRRPSSVRCARCWRSITSRPSPSPSSTPIATRPTSGGLTTVDEAKAFPVKLLESGPAAGAIAAAYVARTIGEDKIIAFDVAAPPPR
ncbi:hydantoinase/oxoprolinase family protein [Actinomadura madurae]|uniref:hydantoinase/oxoprolinase family protein n=1 Tax=Actinomadura madurae TaxID=1993 RepID=UPI00210DD2B7|nr:hydantoinase/oxoprolinase family protein [Actinomadura madurae]